MASFADHLWLIAILLAAASLAALVLLIRTRPIVALATALALLVLAAASWWLDQAIETPTEKVRFLVRSMATAAERGDTAYLISLISPQYDDGAHDQAGLSALIERRVREGEADHVRLAGLEVASSDPGETTARFVAHLSGRIGQATPVQGYPIRLAMTFHQIAGEWKLRSIRRFDILQSAKEIPLESIR